MSLVCMCNKCGKIFNNSDEIVTQLTIIKSVAINFNNPTALTLASVINTEEKCVYHLCDKCKKSLDNFMKEK